MATPTARKSERRENIRLWLTGAATLGTTASILYFLFRKEKPKPLSVFDRYTDAEVKDSNISKRQARQRANQLFTAMDGLWTNEVAIGNAFKNVNGPGLKLIYNKFGVRGDENLGQWLIGDLNDFELEQVRELWQEQGVDPPF